MGKDGNLNFVINFGAYGPDEEISVRSADMLDAETVIIPLENDFVLYATLEPATAGITTRSATLRSFNNSAKLRIVAYKEDSPGAGTYSHAADAGYVIETNGSNKTLLRESGAPFSLTVGLKYTFVAYSYNDNTPVSYVTGLTNENADRDLVWGASDTIQISSSTNTIQIKMRHCFSKVNLTASSGGKGPIKAISGVTIPGVSADLDIASGALTNHSTTVFNHPFTFLTLDDSPISSSRIVFTGNPAADPTSVRIRSININNSYTFTDLVATFAKKLQRGYEYNLTMTIKDVPDLNDDTPPAGFVPYVGAFWKHDQTGERLIRIARPPSGMEADSAWSAVVVKGSDWIVLDRVWPTGVDWITNPAISGNDPGFDTDPSRQVTGGITYVNGVLRPSGTPGYKTNDEYIYFRIGLTSTIPASDVRYGIVLLTYANNKKRHRIWIRQGEAPDYVMNPGDLNGSGAAVADNRLYAQKFSPYNLTTTSANFNTDIGYRGGIPTEYPSQAGAFFQWAGTVSPNNRARIAWDPFSYSFPNWVTGVAPGFWDALAGTHETCPPNYRRPNDGSISVHNASGNVADSEIRQSLWLDPQAGSTRKESNYVWGYYADGFFDRREITNGPTFSYAATAVSATNGNVA
jgi:hypothetical protein